MLRLISLHFNSSCACCGAKCTLCLLQVVVPLGSMTWPNKKHEAIAGKKDDYPGSQRSMPAGGNGNTVV